ncbi:MAG: hypothetical protein ACJAQS_000846 [Porticoccus sp.]|jgi:hypothetical protein
MADILPFKKPKVADKSKAKTLCSNNHHKWKVCKEKQFDVRDGKLVTIYKCERCGKQKVRAH